MKLDIGCGTHKREGFIGCDSIAFDGVDFVFDAGKDPWPFDDESVDEALASHVVEHLTPKERAHFVNELYRVMKTGAMAQIITPYWASGRAYGDPTHIWPAVSEHWYSYLDRDYRKRVPHVDKAYNPDGYDCHFKARWIYVLHPEVAEMDQSKQDFAIKFFKEAIQDMAATLTKV